MKTWKQDYRRLWGKEPPTKMTQQLAKEFHLLPESKTKVRLLNKDQYEKISPMLETLLDTDVSNPALLQIREWFNKEEAVVKSVSKPIADPLAHLEKYKTRGKASPQILDDQGKPFTHPQTAQYPALVTSDAEKKRLAATFPANPPVTQKVLAATPVHPHANGYSGHGYSSDSEVAQYTQGFKGYSGGHASDHEKQRMRKMALRPRPHQFETWDFDRTIIVGDIHGCADELVSLLEAVQFKIGKDRLISVGDVVDRGPKVSDCFRILREYKAWSCLGNHEEPFLKWLTFETHPDYKEKFSGKNNPIDLMSRQDQRETFNALTHQDWIDMGKMQLFFKLDELKYHPLVVHAGLFPGVSQPVEEQNPFAVIRMIKLDDKGETLPFGASNGTYWWDAYEKNPGKHHVIYGHSTATDGPRSMKYRHGLDTGAVYGGALTGLVLPPPNVDAAWHLVCVPAKKAHHVSSAAELSGGQKVIGKLK